MRQVSVACTGHGVGSLSGRGDQCLSGVGHGDDGLGVVAPADRHVQVRWRKMTGASVIPAELSVAALAAPVEMSVRWTRVSGLSGTWAGVSDGFWMVGVSS